MSKRSWLYLVIALFCVTGLTACSAGNPAAPSVGPELNAVSAPDGQLAVESRTPPSILPKLTLQSVQCHQGQVQVKFKLQLSYGATPGTLTYAYGTITNPNQAGNSNNWFYTGHLPSGTYQIGWARVNVISPARFGLSNPQNSPHTYNCNCN